MHREIELEAELFDRDRVVKQLHWGGGTPTFISNKQMSDLMQVTRKYFNLLEDDSGEYAVEIDPREANYETISLLRDIGFNRMSIGVQDFDPAVQLAVNLLERGQSFGDVRRGDTDAGIGDFEHRAGVRLRPHFQGDVTARRGKFDRIGHKVDENLHQFTFVGEQCGQIIRGLRFHVDAGRRSAFVYQQQRGLDNRGYIDIFLV